mmetsp:Transcript_70086/g.226794  ORF Transcript_70086/g.226794 Transcript_70086/m.226794 type:complete len:374 (+) Transcript_70086:840-1961(+)
MLRPPREAFPAGLGLLLHDAHPRPERRDSPGGLLLLGDRGAAGARRLHGLPGRLLQPRHRPELLHRLPRGPRDLRPAGDGLRRHCEALHEDLARGGPGGVLPVAHGDQPPGHRPDPERLPQHRRHGHVKGVAVREGGPDDEGAAGAQAGLPHPAGGGEAGGCPEHDRGFPAAQNDGGDARNIPQRRVRLVRRGHLLRGAPDLAHGAAPGRGGTCEAVHSLLLLCHHHWHNCRLRRHPPCQLQGAGRYGLRARALGGLHRAVPGARLADGGVAQAPRDGDGAVQAGRHALHAEEGRAEGPAAEGAALHRARLRDGRHHGLGREDHEAPLGVLAEPARAGGHGQRPEAVPPLRGCGSELLDSHLPGLPDAESWCR